MTSSTTTHTDHPVNRRQLLLGGTLVGATALAHGTLPAAGLEPSGPVDNSVSTGNPADTVVGDAGDTLAPPAQVTGARMIAYAGSAFFPFGNGTVGREHVNLKGSRATGGGFRLFRPMDIPAGSRIVRAHYYGYRDTNGTQLWWIARRDTATYANQDLTSENITYSGAISYLDSVNLLVAPGYEYGVWAESASPEPYVRGAIVQYIPPAGDFFPISPKRVYDSRVSGGRIYSGQERTVSLRTELGSSTTVTPPGAQAVALNVTLDQTAQSGYLSVRPQGTSWDGTSSINWWTSNIILANGATSKLGGDREVRVRCGGGGSTHFILDVVGYYL